MARNLQADMETLRTVLTYAQNRDFNRASALAEETLASGFEHPMLLNVVATRLELEGRLEDALRLLQRAVSISPGDVGARNALSLCLQRLDRPAEALVQIDELLKRQPDLGFAHANKGNALIALGLLARAKLSHLRALELDPGNLTATAAIASIATHRGEHEEARQWAAKALSIAPGFPDAVLSLAAADLAAGDTGQAERLLHQLIVDMRAGPSDRARASGLLGDVLDAAGRYPEAFDAYSDCNEALRKIHGHIANGTGTRAYTRALSAAMDKTTAVEWKSHADLQVAAAEVREHVFLIGFPRSGTTLLEVVLDGHPDVASIEEHELLTDSVLKFMREPVDFGPLILADDNMLRAFRAAYWERVRESGVNVAGKVFIDKHPLNTLKLPLIARLFPRAKILFARRDPRDVVFSCFRRRFKMNSAMYELLTLPSAAAFYDAVMEFAERAHAVLNLDWHDVRYESLATDFALETRAICQFLALEWSAGMGDFASRVQSRDHATPSTAQLTRGLDRSSIGHWQRYRAQLEPILPTLRPWIERWSYPA